MDIEAEHKKPDALADSILRAAGLSVDDLKSFETVFRDLASSFGSRIAAQTDAAVTAEFIATRSLEKEAVAEAILRSALVGMVPVPKWGSRILLAADRSFVDCGLEALFGSGGSSETGTASARPFTSVDMGIARQIFSDITSSLDHMFSGGDPIFQTGELIESAHLAPGTITETRMIGCTISLNVAGRSGHVSILLPRSAFRPMQDAIARLLRQPAHHLDPTWAKKMRLEVSRAHIEVEAYLQQGSMTLEQLSLLRPGQVLHLPKDAIDQVRLRSGDQALYKCRLGKAGSAFTVRITDPINEEEDLLDELAAG
ncbi:FliM/FliN family flagellar motor switch protein [Phyllobacterium sp. YR531]|uniref:FliM/FliN family flagellar motor switch protein n=1 Tax=Phyllobacterium sp. YR531 TaxID=1144343 RepID=UPI00026F5AD8|nr:FliM/FliN family flagellar motor switch protein [Phyllobacterium sp. YR531]EJN06195.1 flagellar motor switch protein [Phyllobacterium sp. YR531]